MEIPVYTLDDYFKAFNKPCLAFNLETLHHQLPYDPNAVHRHDYYQILILEEGEAEQRIEFDAYQLKAPCVSVLFPKQFHQLSLSPDSKGTVIMFDDALFCSAVLKKELSAYTVDLQKRLNYIPFDSTSFEEVRTIVERMWLHYENLTILKKEQIKFYIKILLLTLVDASQTRTPSRKESEEADVYLRFRELVEEQFKHNRTVAIYAEQLNVTPKRLTAMCQRYTGEAALDVIHERILLEIKRMLVFYDYSNKEIAYELGFDSPSALNKFIAAKMHCSPSELKFRLSHIYK
ncbi:AraC family transcriptional regulator [Bacteroides sedimenti]|uniref:AraC family transcriptional regulator n=1 Tax=Bacteroides sedimenti TaxID=2136147 RepID=A0ABM8I942_9BACE